MVHISATLGAEALGASDGGLAGVSAGAAGAAFEGGHRGAAFWRGTRGGVPAAAAFSRGFSRGALFSRGPPGGVPGADESAGDAAFETVPAGGGVLGAAGAAGSVPPSISDATW